MISKTAKIFIFNGLKTRVQYEKYTSLDKLNESTKNSLKNGIHSLLEENWGRFPAEFLDNHILRARRVIFAKIENKYVGFCVLDTKELLGQEFYYVEFLVVSKAFQKSRLGSSLLLMSIKEEIQRHIFKILLGKSLKFFLITPNIRVLAHVARFSSFVYPDPYSMADDGSIQEADEETWALANELLKKSDNPSRELEREGLVLKQSYLNTPWLIYNNDNAPWHTEDRINIFAKRYLKYHVGEDREFIVRAHLNLFSLTRLLRYILYA